MTTDAPPMDMARLEPDGHNTHDDHAGMDMPATPAGSTTNAGGDSMDMSGGPMAGMQIPPWAHGVAIVLLITNPFALTYGNTVLNTSDVISGMSRQMSAFQLGYTHSVWEPFFDPGTKGVLNSTVSRSLPISDAGVGAVAYMVEGLMGFIGDKQRWRTMPWMGNVADSDHLIGALVITVAVIAFAEVGRTARFINIVFGAWLIAAPWLLNGGTAASKWNGITVGLLLIMATGAAGRFTSDTALTTVSSVETAPPLTNVHGFSTHLTCQVTRLLNVRDDGRHAGLEVIRVVAVHHPLTGVVCVEIDCHFLARQHVDGVLAWPVEATTDPERMSMEVHRMPHRCLVA